MDEVRDYIDMIRKRIEGMVPYEDLEDVMNKVSTVIMANWVDDGNYELRITQVIALVRDAVGGKHKDN